MSMRRTMLFPTLLVLMLGAQLLFWSHTNKRLPDMSIVPDVPGKAAIEALAFGDSQFLFRVLALQIQNCGDTFGRFTALYKYDYKKLYQWFGLLDVLDSESNLVPTFATYYFSQTQNRPDVRYIVDYLYEHSKDRPEKNWWWLIQAMYLANHKLNDKPLALRVSRPLTEHKDVPVLAKQMPAFIYEQMGEYDAALKIMEDIQANVKDIPPSELKFMKYFIDERIHSMEKAIDSKNTQTKQEP